MPDPLETMTRVETRGRSGAVGKPIFTIPGLPEKQRAAFRRMAEEWGGELREVECALFAWLRPGAAGRKDR